MLSITELNPIEMARLKELFEFNSSMFREAMAPLMAQILLWRRNGIRPHLNSIQPKVFFEFVDGKIALKEEFKTASSRVRHAANALNAVPSCGEDLLSAESEFRKRHGLEKYVRGKYVLWFFVELALEIHRCIPKFCLKHTKPPKVRLSLGLGNAMVVIAPRVRCPASLQSFLQRNYCQYIEEGRTATQSTSG